MSAQPGLTPADGDLNGPRRRRSRRSSSGRDLADQARPASPVFLNGGIPSPSALAAPSVSIAVRTARAGSAVLGRARHVLLRDRPPLHPVGAAAAGDVVLRHVTDVAAPGCPAHHPGITPRGVICGERDTGSMGRAVRVLTGPRVPARTMIRTADAVSESRPGLPSPRTVGQRRAVQGLSMPRDRQPPAVTGSTRPGTAMNHSGTKEGLRADLTCSRDPRVHPALGEARVMPPPSGSEIVPLRASNRWAQVWVMPSGVSVVPRQPAARHMESPP